MSKRCADFMLSIPYNDTKEYLIDRGLTMQRIEIPFDELNLNPFKFWNNGLLLTAGESESGKFNSMTIAWGSLGVLWEKPIIQVVVRPSRYTYEFIEKYDSFTVCAFDLGYQDALKVMGTKSGRDTDKIGESKLTVCPSKAIAAPGYVEAELILECKKVYFDDLNPANASERVESFYHGRNYHRFYCGEILTVYGRPCYQKTI